MCDALSAFPIRPREDFFLFFCFTVSSLHLSLRFCFSYRDHRPTDSESDIDFSIDIERDRQPRAVVLPAFLSTIKKRFFSMDFSFPKEHFPYTSERNNATHQSTLRFDFLRSAFTHKGTTAARYRCSAICRKPKQRTIYATPFGK